MKKDNRNMYKLDYAQSLLLVFEKINKLDIKISHRIQNKGFSIQGQ